MSLGQLSKSITDGTHFTPIYTKAGIPFYSVENVSANEFEDTKFISESDHLKLIKRCQPQKGDILMTRIGSLGRTKLISWDCNASIYVSLALIKPNLTVSTDYLYAYSQSNFFYKSVINRSLVNAIPQKINMQDIAAIPIPFPPQKVEQEAIAAALRDAEEAVGLLDTFIAKKRDVKQASMQQLLTGRTRLPGFTADWKEVRLGDNAIVAKGSQLSKSLMIEHGKYPHLNGGISPSGYTEQFNAGPYVIAISEGGNSCGFVHFMKERFWSGGHCYTLQPKGIHKDFLYHALKGKQETIMGLRVGSGLPNVQKTALMNLVLVVPKDIEEQEAIAETLSAMDDELDALAEQISKLRMMKEGMMQDLLTGKVRLV